MQNKIFAAILFGSLLFSSIVSAKITPINQYKFGELNLQSNFRCEDTTGYYSSEPAGYQCSEKNIKGHKCYHNCTLVCNSRDYPYTQDNCVTDKNGTLGGESCAADGVNRYKTCSCSAEYTTCDSPKTHSEEKCTADGGNKYKNCVCPAEYQYTCDGANQSGSGQPCDGKYTACNTGCSDIYNKLCDGPGEEGDGNGCGGRYTSCKCKNTYHTCTGTGVVGHGTACTADGGNKYTSCKCSSNYHTCTGTGVVGHGTACTADGGNKYTLCKCSSNYHACAANETGVGEPCTIDGDNKYTSCRTTTTTVSNNCQPGDIVYRLNITYSGTYSNYYNDKTWHDLEYIPEGGMASGLYPPFACLSPTLAAAVGNRTCIARNSNGEFSAGSDICNQYNNYDELPDSVIQASHERTGIMLTDTIAIDTSENWWEGTFSDVPDMNYGTNTNLLVTTWLAKNSGHEFYFEGALRPPAASYWLADPYIPSALLPNDNKVISSDYFLSGGAGQTESFHAALAATSSTTDNPIGPKSTYNYTFGVSPYQKDASGYLYGDDYSGNSHGSNNYYALGMFTSITGTTSSYIHQYGYVTPAWYCMEKNLNTNNRLYGETVYSTLGHTVIQGTNSTASASFNTNNNKVFYYLPTAGDWKVFATAVSATSGDSDLRNKVFGSGHLMAAWSSTYDLDNSSNPMLSIWTYDVTENKVGYDVDGHLNQSAYADNYIAGYHHTVVKCFIYIPGYQPNGNCSINLQSSNSSPANATYSGTACGVYQTAQ